MVINEPYVNPNPISLSTSTKSDFFLDVRLDEFYQNQFNQNMEFVSVYIP